MTRPRRGMFGLRDEPGRIALVLTRAPHKSVAMVLDYDAVTGEAVICSAWGPNADWCRNLQMHPASNVTVGRLSFTPQQRFLTNAEALQVALDFRAAHPYRLRLISRILGWGDLHGDKKLRDFVAAHPFVAFRPVPAS